MIWGREHSMHGETYAAGIGERNGETYAAGIGERMRKSARMFDLMAESGLKVSGTSTKNYRYLTTCRI